MTINNRIKQVRQYLNMSQFKFAKNLCLSGGYFAGIELETRRANDRIVRLISMTYGVNEEWLKTGKGEMYENYSGAKVEQAIKAFRELKVEYQEYILNLVENLLDVQNVEMKKQQETTVREEEKNYLAT